MQTTLLGVAIAIILALVAALVGPLLIDWGRYRAIFEAEATHLIGVDVHVKGPIDARLLPSPQLTLHDIEIGQGGSDRIRAGALNVEFALAPLMRGEWRATDLHLSGPQLHLGLDKSGHVQAPVLAIGFKPDALTIDRLGIDGGKIVLSDAANGNTVTLDRLYFNGQAASLAGPFKGEGGVTIAGSQFPFRISTGRYADDGKLKIHVNINPVEHPLAIEADGTLAVHDGAPQFDGAMKVQRLVGIDRKNAKKLEPPWHVIGHLKATAASALLQKGEFQYGSADHGVKLTGVADLTFGKKSRFKAELSGRQLDLDGVLGGGDARSAPGDAVRKLVAFAGNAFRPPIPMQVGIGIDEVTLGGGAVQNVRGDISANGAGWRLNDFEFRAPGYTQAKVSGQLTVADNGAVAFTGPAQIESNDPSALSAWLEGRAPPARQNLRPLSVRGDLTLGSEKIAFEHLRATFARKTITGRFAYIFAAGKQPSKLDAALNAPELDLDVALGFGQALVKGSDLARPREMAITADIGRATIAGIEGHDVSARINVDADRWQIDRLSVADLGGASFAAGGNVVLNGPSPQGSLHVDLNAPDPAPVMTVLARFFPAAAAALDRSVAGMAPAKLTAQLSIAGTAPSTAKLGIDGSLGKIKLALNGQAQVAPKQWRVGDIRFDGKLAADDGKALVAMLGLSRYLTVRDGPGALTVKADGPASGRLNVSGVLTANGLDVKAEGTADPFADKPAAALRARVTRADVEPLRGVGGGEGALPVTFAGRVALAGDTLMLNGIDATMAGTNVRGTLRGFARGAAPPAGRARGRQRGRRRPDRRGDRSAGIGRQERCGLDLVGHAVRSRNVRRLCRSGVIEGASGVATAAADRAPVQRQIAGRQGPFRARRHGRRRRRRHLQRRTVVQVRRRRPHHQGQVRARRCRERQPVVGGGAAAGHRRAWRFGRTRRQWAQPGRPHRRPARIRQADHERCRVCRPRPARFRCRNARGRRRASGRRREDFQRGAQGAGERPACGQARRGQARHQCRLGAARRFHRQQPRRRSIVVVHARPDRRRDGCAAGVVGLGGERAARHLHVAERTGDVARAQHRRVGADRLADFAFGRESGEAAQGAATGGAAARAGTATGNAAENRSGRQD